jgi:hypothetical protein
VVSQAFTNQYLEMKNCHVVMTTKNWSNDVHVGFEFGKDFVSNFNMAKEAFLKQNEVLIQEKGFLEDDTYLQFFLGHFFEFYVLQQRILLWTRLNLLFLFNSIYIFLMSHYQII